jgi:hypothetical protein
MCKNSPKLENVLEEFIKFIKSENSKNIVIIGHNVSTEAKYIGGWINHLKLLENDKDIKIIFVDSKHIIANGEKLWGLDNLYKKFISHEIPKNRHNAKVDVEMIIELAKIRNINILDSVMDLLNQEKYYAFQNYSGFFKKEKK